MKTKPIAASDNQEWLVYTFDPVTTAWPPSICGEKVRVPSRVEVKDVKGAAQHADEMIAANPPPSSSRSRSRKAIIL